MKTIGTLHNNFFEKMAAAVDPRRYQYAKECYIFFFVKNATIVYAQTALHFAQNIGGISAQSHMLINLVITL
jgi:hypothetical protein